MSLTAFNDWSIRRKLTFIIGATVWLAMFIGAIAFIVYDQREAKASLANEALVLAKVIAARSSAVVAFKDKKAARSNLASLAVHPSVDSACLFKGTSTLLANHIVDSQQDRDCDQNATRLERASEQGDDVLIDTRERIAVFAPVDLNNKTIGYVVVNLNLKSLKVRLWRFAFVAILIQVAAGVIAYWFTYRLQRNIVNPLQHLREVTVKVSESHDYNLRAKRESGDEVGDLVVGFNDMLHTIQEAHFKLQEAMYELEEKSEQHVALAQSSESRRKQISDYFAGASHDIRQPLNAMGLYIEELQHQVQMPLVGKLAKSVENLETLLAELLDVTKLEEGIKKPQHQKLNLKTLCEKVQSDMGILASDKGIRFKVHCPDLTIETDPLMLERIIRNLVSNSIRYTEVGGVLLAVRPKYSSIGSPQTLSLEIWDTGIGIPSEKLEDIFHSHVQLGNEQQSAQHGFGIGLSIVKRLSEALEYPLKVRSKVGQGTVFKLELATAVSAEKSGSELSATQLSDQQNVAVVDPLAGRLVLLVDDDLDVLMALEEVLTRWGIHVELANDYQAAIEWLSQQSGQSEPLLLISDYQIGEGVTGLDVFAFAEQHLGKAQFIPLLISGESDEGLWQSLKEQHIAGLKKPVKPAKLRALLTHSLKNEALKTSPRS